MRQLEVMVEGWEVSLRDMGNIFQEILVMDALSAETLD